MLSEDRSLSSKATRWMKRYKIKDFSHARVHTHTHTYWALVVLVCGCESAQEDICTECISNHCTGLSNA